MRITFPLRMALVVAAAVAFLHQNATAATINLGDASGFAVLAAAGISVAGPVNSTTITGDIGTYPTPPSVTGLENVVLNGVDQTADTSFMLNAHNALNAAFIAARDSTAINVTTPYAGGFNLASLTPTPGVGLAPGVYRGSSSLSLTGTLTLDAGGDPNAVWIFQMPASTLTTAAGAPNDPASRVVLMGGASACNVFWQVGSSATIGDYSDFVGNILADTSITVDPGATVEGRLLAGAMTSTGAVTLTSDTIDNSVCTAASVPDTGSTLLLLGSGLGTLLAFRRRFFSPA